MPSFDPRNLAGRNVLVVGLGRFGGGVGVTRWLVGQGARVTVNDHAAESTLRESVAALRDLDVVFRLGGHELDLVKSTDLAIMNPAIHKSRSEVFEAIEDRQIPWTTEVNIFCELCPARVIAVTGSYGKSTTATMLTQALDACLISNENVRVHLGGNIGRSLLPDLDLIRPADYVVLELSSAQLEDIPRIEWSPTVAVLTNIHPHHLDRYGSYAEYIDNKLNILGNDTETRTLVLGGIDAVTEERLSERIADRVCQIVRVSSERPVPALGVSGAHNQVNAECALAVVRHLALSDETARASLSSFRGLPHRLEHVRQLNGVRYINDSKSTSPANTVRAIESCTGSLVAIVGGQDRSDDLSQCATSLAASCRIVLCLGESGPKFARAVRSIGDSQTCPVVQELPDLAAAIRTAYHAAQPGDVVLFSPGAPSFDRFDNFDHRGRAFIEAVRNLPPDADATRGTGALSHLE